MFVYCELIAPTCMHHCVCIMCPHHKPLTMSAVQAMWTLSCSALTGRCKPCTPVTRMNHGPTHLSCQDRSILCTRVRVCMAICVCLCACVCVVVLCSSTCSTCAERTCVTHRTHSDDECGSKAHGCYARYGCVCVCVWQFMCVYGNLCVCMAICVFVCVCVYGNLCVLCVCVWQFVCLCVQTPHTTIHTPHRTAPHPRYPDQVC